jgi:hypothetical protein
MDKNGEGEMMEPPRVPWPVRAGGSCQLPKKAGAMIPLEILNCQPLFSFLYKIDLDLAEQARARHCPIAGGHYSSTIKRWHRSPLHSLLFWTLIVLSFSQSTIPCHPGQYSWASPEMTLNAPFLRAAESEI